MTIANKITGLFAGILTCLAIVSCNKPDIVVSPKEGNIYMPKAAGTSNHLSLLVADTPQYIPFAAAYGGLHYPSADIAVGFAIKQDLVTSYNSLNGTSYELLPAASYNIPSLAAVIKSGKTLSDVLNINVSTAALDKAVKYMLPVGITSVSAGAIDSALGTTYFIVDTIQKLEKDITGMATLTVSKENNGGPGAGEGSPKLVDNDYNSKFLMSDYYTDFWVQLSFPAATVLGAYTITSGNDAPERDAKDWMLKGSNDGSTWTTLDSKTGESFPDRNQTRRFEFDNHTGYTSYRLFITANGGSDLLQISEWRVITYP